MSSLATPETHTFDSSLGFKSHMPEELLSRTELYSKIKNKPQSTKGASKEISRLERTLQFVSNEGRLKKKTKLIDSIDMKPLVSPVYADNLMNLKKFKPDKTKAKSFQIDPQERRPSFEKNPDQEDRSMQPTVPYSLVPALEPARHSSVSFKYVKSYAVNTFKGLIREYNEDRVSIILNILQPPTKKTSKWPNCSFFGVKSASQGLRRARRIGLCRFHARQPAQVHHQRPGLSRQRRAGGPQRLPGCRSSVFGPLFARHGLGRHLGDLRLHSILRRRVCICRQPWRLQECNVIRRRQKS